MPYRSMNLQELALMLGADARRLERMAQRDEIPCQKVGGELRFNRAEITEWLQQNMATMHRDHLAEVDAGITAHRETARDEAIISPLLRLETVSTQLNSRGKRGALGELVAMAQTTGLVYDEEALLEAVVAREDLCSTAIEGGVAIPHPRRPLPYAIAEPILVVAKAPGGMLFGAPDSKPTKLFFLTASQDDRHHLHILARLFRMLGDVEWIEDLLGAETPEEMIDLLRERERAVIAQSQ